MHHYYHEASLDDRRRSKFAVVMFLPPHLDAVIYPLRERYDPDYNLISSHISVAFPFEIDLSLDQMASLIKREVDSCPPIEVTLNSIGDFYPREPIIYWNVSINPALEQLYFQLYSALDLPLPFKHYRPHVTVAREISRHRVMLVKDKIVSYLPSEKFVGKGLDLITPLAGQRWVSVRTFPLASTT